MKNILLLLCGLFPLFLNAQIHEDFTHNQFPDTPTKWRGHAFAFGVNGDSLLQSQTINTTYISTENQLALGVVWEFSIRLDFNPSSQNQLRVYLMADNDTLTAPLNGYFIQIGENGATDRYHLFRQDGRETTLLLSSTPKHRINSARIEDRIRVHRDSTGHWELLTAIDQSNEFLSEGMITDIRFTQSSFFGIHCRFTSTNSDKFYFDYFSIDTSSTPITPIVSPKISDIVVPNDSMLFITFNKLLDGASATDIANYTLDNGYGHPITASLADSTVTLIFNTPFSSSSYTLTINNVMDTAGIAIAPDTKVSFNYSVPKLPETKLLPDDVDEAWFYDDFSSELLSHHWRGETASFEIIDERVRVTDIATSPTFLSTASNRSVNTVWEAGIQVDGVLSSGNYVRLYLTSTNDSLLRPHQGYHLQIDGARGKHVYKLVRQTGGNRYTFFLSDSIETQGKFRARVRVICDSAANWRIFADEYDNGTFQPILRNNGDTTRNDGTYTTSGYAGYFVNFSPTRRGDYKLDYLLIKPLDPSADPIPDSVPPKIVSASFVDSLTLHIVYDKSIDLMSAADINNYSLNGVSPRSIEIADKEVTLPFHTPFATGEYTLSVGNIRNSDGFAMETDTTITLHYTEPYIAQPFDVVINEIMARPNGVSGLPEQEYIELYNRSNEIISLIGWKYESLTRSYPFTQGEIAPNSYLILCHQNNVSLFAPFGNVLGVSSWPPLVDGGTTLTLTNPQGVIIDEVAYHTSWYRDNQKRNGGWSLERISPQVLCLDADNWMASTDSRGGSPGIQNSVYDRDSKPNLTIAAFTIQGTSQLAITFSHSLDTSLAIAPERYSLNNGFGHPQQVALIDTRSIVLYYNQPFSQGLSYTLAIAALPDCTGEPNDINHPFFVADNIQPSDILINEILSYPKPDGVDFVEIYNHSNKTFDLQELYVASVNRNGGVGSLRKVSNEQHLFYPGEYKVLTMNPSIVKAHYPEALLNTFIEMPNLPNFNNEDGGVMLSSNGLTIDSLYYTPAMQSPFISNHRGISLERQSFNNATLAPGNFRSAATSVGGATPGYLNSQGEATTNEDNIFLTSKTFSPDNDGFEDLLEINYSFPESGYMANMDIYNDKGQLVRRLQRNQSMAIQGVITWDGLSDTNQRLPVGIYIAAIEIYNAKGVRKIYRKSFVLAAKM